MPGSRSTFANKMYNEKSASLEIQSRARFLSAVIQMKKIFLMTLNIASLKSVTLNPAWLTAKNVKDSTHTHSGQLHNVAPVNLWENSS